MAATEASLRLQQKSKSSMPWTACGCTPCRKERVLFVKIGLNPVSCGASGPYGTLPARWKAGDEGATSGVRLSDDDDTVSSGAGSVERCECVFKTNAGARS